MYKTGPELSLQKTIIDWNLWRRKSHSFSPNYIAIGCIIIAVIFFAYLAYRAYKYCNKRTSMFIKSPLKSTLNQQSWPERTNGSNWTQGTNQIVQTRWGRKPPKHYQNQRLSLKEGQHGWLHRRVTNKTNHNINVPRDQWTSNPVLNFQNHGWILYLLWNDILPSQIVFIFANLNLYLSVL